MQIGALIRRAALYYGDAPCLVEGGRVVSFREFDALTDRLGNALLKRGFVAGDRIGVLLPNGIDCLVAYYALAKAGLVRVSLNTRETLADHAYKLSHSGCRGVIHKDFEGLDVEIAIGSQELDELQTIGIEDPLRHRSRARRALSPRLHRRHDGQVEGGDADNARRARRALRFPHRPRSRDR